MSVGVQVEKLEENKVALQIEVGAEQVNSAIDRAMQRIKKEVKISGFRQGHVPKHILKKVVGEEAILRNAVEMLIPQAYQEALQKSQLDVITEPELSEVGEISEGKPFTFKLAFQVKPDVELGEYKSLTLTKRDVPVTEEHVQTQLQAMGEQQALLVPVEDRGLRVGDMAEVTLEAESEGKKILDAGSEPLFIELGKGMILADLEYKMIDMKKGEAREIEVAYPQDYANKELAGKAANFKVAVREIKEKKLPEFNDAFAKLYKVDTLEQLKTEIRAQLEKARDARVEDDLRQQAAEAVLSAANVDTPQVLIDGEMRRILIQLHRNLESYGVDPHEHFTEHGPDEKLKDPERQKEVEETAARKAKLNLILDNLMKKENIVVSLDEINREVRLLAQSMGQPEAKVRQFLEAQDGFHSIRQSLSREKALDVLVKNAVIKEEEKKEESEKQEG